VSQRCGPGKLSKVVCHSPKVENALYGWPSSGVSCGFLQKLLHFSFLSSTLASLDQVRTIFSRVFVSKVENASLNLSEEWNATLD